MSHTSTNRMFEWLNNRKCTHKGIRGTLKHTVSHAIYPYPHTVERLTHEPTPAGKRTQTYIDTKRELGDDWVTDLTTSIETYCAIAHRLGYTEESDR